ncbi:Fic family protein [Sphingomonas soli]|uniref:Fic family protein n=1 Tax=Sphingomonas soli TaxID=266127 RepID=UPI000A035113|nr:Fic family protein [Sphingomonas soli]
MPEYTPLFELLKRTGPETFEKTHPFITFRMDLKAAVAAMWLNLGEAKSKCEHLAGVPLRPDIASTLHRLYLAKGVHATAAIEGNTLSEEQVLARIEGSEVVPQSQKYLQTEIDNVLRISNEIADSIETNGCRPITPDDIKLYNREILAGLDVDEHVNPGVYRTTSVGVMDYKAPDCRDCPYLMEKLCDWLNQFKAPNQGDVITYGILKAIIAHLYLAWIHAFGDGNGRTARAVEVRILMESGLPSTAAHLLSNHYNETRSEYYRMLSRSSKNGGDPLPFVNYSIGGLVDQLRSQLTLVRTYQWTVAWENYVYEKFGQDKTSSDKRQIKLVLALTQREAGAPRSEIRRLTAELAEEYANKTSKTLSRDINNLIREGLIVREGSVFKANKGIILAFLPRRRKEDFHVSFPPQAATLIR